MHRQVAQAKPQEEPRQLRIAGHFAAHGDRHRALSALAIAIAISFRIAGMQRVVEVGDRIVGAIHRQRVLDQVVRADRQEIQLFQE